MPNDARGTRTEIDDLVVYWMRDPPSGGNKPSFRFGINRQQSHSHDLEGASLYEVVRGDRPDRWRLVASESDAVSDVPCSAILRCPSGRRSPVSAPPVLKDGLRYDVQLTKFSHPTMPRYYVVARVNITNTVKLRKRNGKLPRYRVRYVYIEGDNAALVKSRIEQGVYPLS
ncbi:MAG: hypothetical protein ACKVOP_07710 [Sphingomonadaceae bacterium]